jgi:sec-independent protein translocase protein TatC
VRRIRPIAHEDRLSVVDHLDELRTRLVISVLAFVVAWGICGWQNDLVLEIVNAPLPIDDSTGEQIQPITLGPAEAFTTTLMNAAYFALILAAPVILYEIYAFILPAFSTSERRVATPLLVLVPVLFIAGVVFCYFVVLGPALNFLLNFNSDEFNTQVRAKDYYSFVSLLMLAMGLGFQIPVGVLAACKAGLTSAEKLRRNRRYAIVAIVIAASLLPTLDPVTLLLESLPFYLLFELSILLAARWGRPAYEFSDEPAAEGL